MGTPVGVFWSQGLQSDTRIHATALRWLAELEDAIRVSLGYAVSLTPKFVARLVSSSASITKLGGLGQL